MTVIHDLCSKLNTINGINNFFVNFLYFSKKAFVFVCVSLIMFYMFSPSIMNQFTK